MTTTPRIKDIFRHDFIFTDEEIYTYAKISGDSNPIHVSDSYAEKSIFGRCIVHGYYSISIFSKIYGTVLYSDGHILIRVC
jgi:acyl dehydratase